MESIRKAINSPINEKAWALFFLLLLVSSCTDNFLPKPKAYNRILLPEAHYRNLNQFPLPYTFEYNGIAQVLEDNSKENEPYWLDIHYPDFEANIQITYKALDNNPQKLKEVISDAFRLASKHQVRAYSIEESVVKTPLGKTGVFAEISGEVPSQFQFFSTDSSQHFIRGALYFNTATKNDSLAPIIEYIKRDMVHMLNTLQWNTKL